jgi:CheY-like chemotaxis protein
MFKLLWLKAESPALNPSWDLSKAEIDVVPISGLEECLRALQAENPDCVLVTQEFPTLDRLDVLETIHGVEPSSATA